MLALRVNDYLSLNPTVTVSELGPDGQICQLQVDSWGLGVFSVRAFELSAAAAGRLQASAQ